MNVNYHDYLQLDKILNAQLRESEKANLPAHDEMLFIIIHQAYELWFKQLHFEADSVVEIMAQPEMNDNSPELQTVVHRLNRTVTILRLLVQQIEVMETMTPMDFLEFRDMLRPASGFQSWQFKELEAKLGLRFEHRHGKEYYTAQLRTEHVDLIKKAEKGPSLLYLLNLWLERMPFFKEEENWKEFTAHEPRAGVHPFWSEYRYQYIGSLADAEKENGQFFDDYFLGDSQNPDRILSREASRAALFIMLYRGHPMLQLPFQLLNALIEIDIQLSSWRYRHMNMVQRMIGTRIGTGGSSGKDYLKAAADKHYIFRDLSQLTSFLIERRRLPVLPVAVSRRLGFA
jgi:tryptophan 2,3-dioxygenase